MNPSEIVRAMLEDIPVTVDIQLSVAGTGGAPRFELVFQMPAGSKTIVGMSQSELAAFHRLLNRALRQS